jgi:hypothetical protein
MGGICMIGPPVIVLPVRRWALMLPGLSALAQRRSRTEFYTAICPY